jgi:hypothetical protein
VTAFHQRRKQWIQQKLVTIWKGLLLEISALVVTICGRIWVQLYTFDKQGTALGRGVIGEKGGFEAYLANSM